jgi:hypothetical protein
LMPLPLLCEPLLKSPLVGVDDVMIEDWGWKCLSPPNEGCGERGL